MAKRSRKPKRVSYQLLTRESNGPIYERLDSLIWQHHQELHEARIALAWCTSWTADVDGRVILGKCKKASDLDRELAAFDFIILLQRAFWEDPSVTSAQRDALLDHELCHASVTLDPKTGEPLEDERGRIVYRLRKHDLEEFSEIAERHGCWKRDIEHFATVLERARSKPHDWVGFSRLREQLVAAGADVPLETIRGWGEAERREAEVWATVMVQQAGSTTKPICPRHVATVLEAAAPVPRVDSLGALAH